MVTESPAADPVSVYDRIAPSFAQLATERRAYLDAIDRLVVSHLPPAARTLLDVGAGDGRRARAIAAGLATALTTVVLAEPAAGMRRAGGSAAAYIDLRAEHLHKLDGEFDIILCLWNVLGHVFPQAARAEVMCQFHRLLSPRGRLFIDVNHRYNTARYGLARTAIRWLYDRVRPSEENGDVIATLTSASVRGHVFTHREVLAMAGSAGLAVENRFVVDYETGAILSRASQGNLLYIMKS
jgi:SAM-dependent methyltransferase